MKVEFVRWWIGVALAAAGVAAADSTPPQLINFSVSPQSVDTSAGPATLTVSITAQDQSNGFGNNPAGNGSLTLSLPSGSTVISRQGFAITSGTSTNPFFQFALTLPQFTPAGTYSIGLTLTDNASNTSTYNAATLQSLGFISSIAVSDGAFGSVTLSASTANLAPAGGAGSVQVIASSSGVAWSASSSASWLTILSGASGVGTGTIDYYVSANNTSLQRTGIITVNGQTFTVIQAAGLSSLNTAAGSLAFTYQIGGAAPAAQTITAYSSGSPLNFTASASSVGNWLFVSPASGVTSAVLSVFVNPAGLAAGAYVGSVTVSSPGSANGAQTEPVTLTVTSGAPVTVSPAALSFSYKQGGALPVAQNISVGAAQSTAFGVSVSSVGGWLAVSPASGSTPATLAVSANPAGLAPGSYSGSVAIAGPAGTQSVPVTLVVTASPALAVNPASLTFVYTIGGAAPAAQSLAISGATSGVSFTASAASAGNWLVAGASSGVAPGGLAVSVNPAGLAAGQYAGSISLTAAGGAPQSVPVTLIVNPGAGTSVTPLSLSFAAQAGSTVGLTQNLTILSSDPNATFSVTVSTFDSGPDWLAAGPTVNLHPGAFSVTVAPAQLAAGVHTGQVTVTGPNFSQQVPVTVTVTGSSGVTVSPASLIFSYQTGAAAPPVQNLAVRSNGAAPFTVSIVGSGSAWLMASPSSGTTPATVSVSINPAGLVAGAYSGSIVIAFPSLAGAAQTVPVTLTVSGLAPVTATPAASQINYQVGDPNPNAPSFRVSGPAGPFTASVSSAGNWLAVSPASGTLPATLSAQINASGLAPGSYTGTIQVAAQGAAPAVVTIALTVVGPQSLTLAPGALAFTYQAGAATPAAQILTVACANSALAFRPTASSAGNWLSVAVPSAQNNNQIIVTANPAGLAPNTYQGTVTVAGVGACNTVQSVPVTLTVGAAGAVTAPLTASGLSFSPAALSFAASAGGASPAPQSISIQCGGAAAAFTATAASDQGWLSVGPFGGSTPATLTVSANPAGLAAGSYSGTIGATAGACGAASLTVAFSVGPGSQPSTALALAPASLAFTYQTGGAGPPSQTISLTGPNGVAFTATASSGWISVSPPAGSAPATLIVSVVPAGLLPGTYSGSLALTATRSSGEGSLQNVPVTLTVTAGSSPPQAVAPIAFTYQLGDPAPAPQTLQATGAPARTAFTASASSPSNWLSVTPVGGILPAALAVAVNPAGLAAGSYTGSITITPAGNAAPPQIVPVTLQIAGQVPTLSSLLNGGSQQIGPLAPGEIISIFGQGLGPAAGAGLALAADGSIGSALAGTRVLFDGVAAPLLYAQAGQINAVVPYSVAGKSTVQVLVEVRGTDSAISSVLVAQAAPAIFTLDQSGQGPGAILNQDTSVNSGLNPADRGSIVTLFGSGAGLLIPAAADGSVTAQLGRTALPVSVLIDGQDADITYAGPAPGLVSGALQVNFRIPDQATTGKAVGLLLKVGRFTSQPGVTLAIR